MSTHLSTDLFPTVVKTFSTTGSTEEVMHEFTVDVISSGEVTFTDPLIGEVRHGAVYLAQPSTCFFIAFFAWSEVF